MSFSSSYSILRLTPNRCDNLFFCSPQNPFRIREFRVYRKRRRLRLFRSNPTLQSQFNFSFDNNVFQNLPSLDLLTPVLGLTSGIALYLSSRLNLASGGENNVCDIGEWILFTSPTPFNRFVILRCPSISFEGSQLMEDVNERLVKEDRHFVRLNSGRMIQASRNRGEEPNELEYQRLCINTEDGGVISIDWPANLDLSEEHGLDTTVLVVPGTAEGSMDEKVKAFVKEAVFCGFFPVVMNPRGCASSPLTTPRLFTAADSDDISTAIQFINKARPWNTLMGVGWGYGANMLTKYLAEAGEKTPLTAATCIDNPFDLEEATRLTPYHIALNEKLTSGLVDILRSNKELFLGRAKGFDVEKALSAKSVRDFDKAISMVSYGFEAIEDFYSKCSSRSLVGKVKIPVLYIQNDGGSVPLFSTPRGLIAENPFTSLLLCSCSSSRATVSWCHHLTIEWLTAVELGLLKGRHPLLKDVDISINPSKGLTFAEGRLTGKGGNTKKLLDLSRLNSVNGYSVGPRRGMLEDGDTAPSIHLQSRQDSLKDMELQEKGLHRVHNDMLAQSKLLEAELAKEEAELEDGEGGQVLQTAQVAMNMLDVTMPGTLKEAEKQKVLAAVNQGETLMKALQDAVPEDVREKLTAAVSVIMHAQGTNLKQGIERIPKMQSGFKSKVHESVSDAHSTDEIKRTEGLADGTDNNQVGSERATAGQGSESRTLDNMQSSNDVGQSQSISGDQGDISSSVRKDASETGKIHESDDLNNEKASLHADSTKPGSVINVNLTTQDEKEGSTDEIVKSKADPDGGVDRVEMKYNNSPRQKEEKVVDSLTDQNNAAPSGSSEAQPEEGERNDHQKKDLQHPPDQNKSTITDSNAPTFNVSQALDALTGMDDSTQVAVNSVFGVLENMITQFEEEKEENGSHDGRELRTDDTNSVPETQDTFGKKEGSENDNKLRETKGSKDNQSMISDRFHDPRIHNDHGNSSDLGDDSTSEWLEEESPQNPVSSEGNGSDDSQEQIVGNSLDLPINNDHIVGRKMVADYSYRPINSTPSYINASQYEDFLHSEYFQRYLLSKQTTKPLDVDTTTALLFDYFPEEGQWMLLEQPGENGDSAGDVTTHSREPETPAAEVSKMKNYIEPSYVILDTERQHDPFGEFETIDNTNGYSRKDRKGLEELMQLVKITILDSLRVEVDRRLSASDMEEMESQLAIDIETVATAVSLSIGDYKELNDFEGKEYVIDNSSEKVGTVNGENVVRAISSAVQSTSYLTRVLPVGVIIGSSLAGLRKYFDLSTVHDEYISEVKPADETQVSREKNHGKASIIDIDQSPVYETSQNGTSHSPSSKEVVETGLKTLNKDDVMVGAVTAALGASALLAPLPDKDPLEENETAESSSKIFKEKDHQHKEPGIPEGAVADKHQINMVTSLAEKALSVAGPVVPMKEDGELDQERLVAMLADLGQRGGVLRLVGKIALLWGGIRGAMSLTDRLITFLHIAERPLYQRILGFVGMVLVLWSPVIVPLLPALVQSWTKKTPAKFAELVSILGFYVALMILVMLWGKRIRGYQNPHEQYGLELTSSTIKGLLMGLIGGVILVVSIQSVNSLLGCVSWSWPSNLLPSSLDLVARLKVYGKLLVFAVRGIATATGIVLVEELVFRSWLPDEIAADFGYHWGIIISGLAFSLFQRSLMAIPGLWLLSLALSGIRQRNEGSLSVPIGLRTGIMASSFVLQTSGFPIYKANHPLWVTEACPFQPFSGVVGVAFALLLATIVYPRQPLEHKNLKEEL
ncbi:uncharacterized protein LOC105767998 isoform X1 [Gossypium raimondii]|uniref:AB hydrolase-1 domain-containing protein n=2 Tax=Gossypium raimondii TaxID=29730 RepID=A0A0D2RTP2_GOSRA|nr:uncharacterized protein LOC105767998 isoform X1 [Gossypium raimondii]KJB54528.1 hypothetical protein B456_009G037900 [Gossypium raimondii]